MRTHRSISRPPVSLASIASFAPLALLLTVGGCGGTEATTSTSNGPDPALVAAAGSASTALEYGFAAASVVGGIDPSGVVTTDALGGVARGLVDDVGACLTWSSALTPDVGMDLKFAAAGCPLPLSVIELRGDMNVDYVAEPTAPALRTSFDRLHVFDASLDGTMEFGGGADTRDWSVSDGITVTIGDELSRLDGDGAIAWKDQHTTAVFNGSGTLSIAGTRYTWVADEVKRKYISDCFPESGSISVTATAMDGTPSTLTLQFDSDRYGSPDSKDTGWAHAHFGQSSLDVQLPPRACKRL